MDLSRSQQDGKSGTGTVFPNGERPTDDQCLCDGFYDGLQDANYNVLGIVDSDGELVERYEYTPYGQRTVYKSAGCAGHALVRTPSLDRSAGRLSLKNLPQD